MTPDEHRSRYLEDGPRITPHYARQAGPIGKPPTRVPFPLGTHTFVAAGNQGKSAGSGVEKP